MKRRQRTRAARATSLTIMIARRESRSASTPAAGPAKNVGTKRVSRANATASPFPVNSSSSEKSATTLSQSPICDTAFAAYSVRKARL